MKDIGSIFPLTAKDISLIDTPTQGFAKRGNRINFSLCREAIYAIANKYETSEKIVLIPAYTCMTVINPFIQQGWKCYYYSIGLNLRIDVNDLLHKCELYNPTIVVVHPYCGMELNSQEIDTLGTIRNNGAILIEDITQCIYTESRPEIFDYFTGSYRKWYKVPDGGFVESGNLDGIQIPEEVNGTFVHKQTDAMYLRNKYFETNDEIIKNISIKLNKEAVSSISELIKCHKMSDFSIAIMDNEDNDASMHQRFSNYKYLYNNIHQSQYLKFVCNNIDEVTTPPLYFPIYVSNRAEVQKRLALNHIYAPVLWPVGTEELLINDNIIYIYNHILMIPIDQRYNKEDMYRVLTVLNA